jgi:RHS repeat-associated protein
MSLRRGLWTSIRLPAAVVLAISIQLPAMATPNAAVADAAAALPADPDCTSGSNPAVPAASKGAAPAPRRFTAAMSAPAAKPTKTRQPLAGAYTAAGTPRQMTPGETAVVKVTVTNVTDAVWSAADYWLSNRWVSPGGSALSDPVQSQPVAPSPVALPGDVAPGKSVTVNAAVTAPRVLAGNKRESLALTWDLYSAADLKPLSETGHVAALSQQVTVDGPSSNQLGLERFYQYSGNAAGAGSNLLVNQASGNAIFSYDALSNPSRGLATFVRLTYNSLDSSNSYVGAGWSVAASTLSRLGTPLDFRGSAAPGWPQQIVLTDGDGTGHTFTLDTHDSDDRSQWTYTEPAGVHLYLQKQDGSDPSRAWLMTRPDRTQAFFDGAGYQTATVDKNGNQLTFHYQPANIGGHSVQALTDIADATGRRTLTLNYAQPGDRVTVFSGKTKKTVNDLADADVVGQLLSITDISGRKITFTYGDDGLLRQLTDGAGGPQPKNFTFGYSDPGGGGTKLTRVTDPVGNASTLTYDTSQAGQAARLRQLTDRRGNATAFAYSAPDQNGQITSTATDANGHATRYLIDRVGRPVRLTNAKSEVTQLSWDEDNNVVTLVENNGATTTFQYDPKTGMPLQIRDAEAFKGGYAGTRLEYRTALDGHVADLTAKTTPEGRKWVFGYDNNGNLISVTDPKGSGDPTKGDFTSRYVYDGFGQLSTVTDANGHSTKYGDYDASGYPRSTTDPFGCRSVVAYDVAGDVVLATDANNHTGTFSYDLFKRPLSSKIPKDTANNKFIITPGPRYDANDNVLQSTAPNGAVTTTRYDADDNVVAITGPKDTPTGPAKTSTNTYDPVGNLIKSTKPKGTLTSDSGDFTTTYSYDPLNRPTSLTDATGARATTTYDDVGNVITQVDPNKNATADPNDFTTKSTYDLDHRTLTVTDASGATTSARYDKDSNQVAATDPDGNTTETTLDQRAMPTQMKVPHAKNGDTVTFNTTTYEYDQVGNRTKTTNPRGFAATIVYDALNRVKQQDQPTDPGDPNTKNPDSTFYGYDRVGNVAVVSAPPSNGQQVRNDTRSSYFDNGWVKTSTDPFGIQTSYDYDELGDQTSRTFTGQGGSTSRTMAWTYYPDGKLNTRSDDGVPPGSDVVLVDNSDTDSAQATGAWATAGTSGDDDHEGFDYRTHPGGNNADSFTWNADIPADGTYEVFVRYPKTAQATNATYTVEHDGGQTDKKVDQTQQAGEWVSLGTFDYTADTTKKITLSANADATVAADAVKLVRDHDGDTSKQRKTFTQTYDPNDNLVGITDDTPGTAIDAYAVTYDELDRPTKIEEKNDGAVKHTTTSSYDANSNLLTDNFDDDTATYTYDPRDLITKITNKTGDRAAKDTTFDYTTRGEVSHVAKGNHNTVDLTYFLDGLLQHQIEKKSGGDTVNEHTPTYDQNGNHTKDVAKIQDADTHDLKTTTTNSTYDARDRVTKVEKTGADDSTENYTYDANNNTTEQTVAGTTTTYKYDRNRLTSATATGGSTSIDHYDPFGRLDHVNTAGQLSDKYTYDGFDHISRYQKGTGPAAITTSYTYDPLDRTTQQKTSGGGAPSHTTDLNYLGLTDQVLNENLDGKLHKTYQYSANGTLISQTSFDEDGKAEDSLYGYNPHSDVETTTGDTGDTQATYGYTAYGQNDNQAFTGADKPGANQPDAQPFNSYRFNAKRFDPASGTYDMGFRDYNPGQNRFLTLDLYNGALDDLGLTTDPFTNNRYALGGGNPLSNIEIDGHFSLGGLVHSAAHFVSEHKADIAGFAAGLAVGVACEAVTAGAGSIGCAALSGAVGNMVTYGLSDGPHTAGGFLTAGAEGAITGAAFGAVGKGLSKLGGKVLGKAGKAGKGGEGDAAAARPPTGKEPTSSPGNTAKPPAEKPAAPAEEPAPAPAKPSTCNSFIPGTQVLLANGKTKPIEKIKPGDEVRSTDPDTGKTSSQKVVASFSGTDYDHLIQITVDTDGNKGHRTGAILATEHHLFWNPKTHTWTRADHLTPTSTLRTPDGHTVHVIHAYHAFTHPKVYDLTIATTHTYYIEAGDKRVLVHNCGPKVWEPGRPGVDTTPQGALPRDAGIRPGEALNEGGYHYVVRPNGSLRAMQDDAMWALESSAGHTSLAEGQPVLMAGTFDVDAAGSIFRFDNFSGHYQPSDVPGYTPLEDVARAAFARHRLPAPGAGAWNPFNFD